MSIATPGELDKGMHQLWSNTGNTHSGFPHDNLPLEQCSELTQAIRNMGIGVDILGREKENIYWSTF